MKLSEVIHYATSHNTFRDFLSQRRINPDSAHEILAKITNETDSTIEHRIYIDFGNRGSSSNDVRVIIDYNKNSRDFAFIQIDSPTR